MFQMPCVLRDGSVIYILFLASVAAKSILPDTTDLPATTKPSGDHQLEVFRRPPSPPATTNLKSSGDYQALRRPPSLPATTKPSGDHQAFRREKGLYRDDDEGGENKGDYPEPTRYCSNEEKYDGIGLRIKDIWACLQQGFAASKDT
ncbi:hypothetical protein MMC10_010430 [Thelotrema lepadinum]|nr:hypothetical protein [Thelotrema lepadinum]